MEAEGGEGMGTCHGVEGTCAGRHGAEVVRSPFPHLESKDYSDSLEEEDPVWYSRSVSGRREEAGREE